MSMSTQHECWWAFGVEPGKCLLSMCAGDAAVMRAEEVAPSADVRNAARKAREDLGTVDADDLPIKDYDSLSGQEATIEINGLDDAKQLRVVLAYERAHKNRKGVSTAAQKRLTALADDSVSA